MHHPITRSRSISIIKRTISGPVARFGETCIVIYTWLWTITIGYGPQLKISFFSPRSLSLSPSCSCRYVFGIILSCLLWYYIVVKLLLLFHGCRIGLRPKFTLPLVAAPPWVTSSVVAVPNDIFGATNHPITQCLLNIL